MAKSGTTCLVSPTGTIFRKYTSTWMQNWVLNNRKDCEQIIKGNESFTNFLIRMDSLYGIQLTKISSFESNNSLITLSQLYPERSESDTNVVFVKCKGLLCLLTRGSKTLHEFKLCQHDSKGHSNVPLLLDSNLTAINL